jgi:hypothetical protein
MFRVGQKVVCVDDSYFEDQITKGKIYQVHSIAIAYGDVWIRLCEVYPENDGYRRRRFRPIVERKTDISIFKSMLTSAGKKERVNAR